MFVLKRMPVVAGIIFAGLLSGCSNKPSSSEVQRLAEQIIGPCEYISVRPFTLLNGIPQGEGFYRVETRFILNFDSGRLYLEGLTKYNERLAEVEAKYQVPTKVKQEIEGRYGFQQSDVEERMRAKVGSTHEVLSRALAELGVNESDIATYIEARDASIPYTSVRDSKNGELVSYMYRQLQARCPKLDRSIARGMFPGFYDNTFTYRYQGLDAGSYSTGNRYEYNWTLNMMKTDNGWQGVR